MIPLARRTSHKLETTLLSYSRQSLPRPFRLYSTPTKKSNAPGPALGVASGSNPDFPAYMHASQQQSSNSSEIAVDDSAMFSDMHGFLQRPKQYTLLPTPLPQDSTSKKHDLFFIDTPTQDSAAIINACVHNLFDVPRAKQVFDLLRSRRGHDPILSTSVYNSMMKAYVEMATTKDTARRSHWIEDACALYEAMEANHDNVPPSAGTYALMMQAWIRFNPDSQEPVSRLVELYSPDQLLEKITARNIPVSLVVSDKAFENSEEAEVAIKLFSKAAVDMNLSKVVNELGAAQVLGRQDVEFDDVPDVIPVMKPKKPELQVTHDVDGSVVDISVVSQPETVEHEIPFNLVNLRKHLANVTLHRRALPDNVAARQKLLEESVYDVAVARWKHEAETFEELGLGKKGLDNADIKAWMWNWHLKLASRIQAEIAELVRSENKLFVGKSNNTRLGPFLSLISPEKLSLITILEIMQLQGSGGVSEGMKTARALIHIGRAVEIEHKAQMCKKNNIAVPVPNHPRDNNIFNNYGYRALLERRVVAQKLMEDAEEWTTDWSQTVRVRVGSFLVDALMDVATVTRTGVDKKTGEQVSEEQPAFFHSYEYLRGQKLGVIKLNPVVSERIAKDQVRETLHPRHLPMLVKPKPWLSHDQGGYLYHKTSVMRYKDSQEQQSYVKEASKQGNLELVYASLDVLGSTPWKINREIFDVVLKVWNSGERLGKIPPATYDEPEPEKPEGFDTDPKIKVDYLARHKQYMIEKANNHSDRCSTNYKIEIARAFLGDTMYMPHNLDFRGRAYPIPPHLSHIGDDLSRGLLKFAEYRPLGERGLRWLKIHLANLYGYDKASFDERVEFVHEHLDDIYDSAENPLEGRKWWQKADDPWQCLATCKELRAALESPDPLAFESNLPVHQDGTCNGLQHYAALGGDARGAQQVNLDITDRPSDVYTHVASMAEKVIAEDAKKGEMYAQMLSGKISRKIVKQTVMTTVYGVTFIGAREQIEKQLRDRPDILDVEHAWLASSYLAKVVLACIGDLFNAAKHIQNYLTLSAKLISKSIPPERIEEVNKPETKPLRGKGQSVVADNRIKTEQMTSVIWTTALGLPIVQPYRQTKRKQIMTSLQTVFISDPNVPAAVNSQKQSTAFPPNFVHSLDATHMMLTALECRNRNITFASVHDSYWTHPASVDEMSQVIRETFIALHSSDVLGRLDSEFRERYKDYMIPVSVLRSGGFIKKLNDASAEIVAHTGGEASADGAPKQGLLSDTAPDVEELGINEVKPKRDTDVELETVEDGADAKPKSAPKRRGRGSKTVKSRLVIPKHIQDIIEGTTDEAAATEFISVADLLPPLPQKGTFDVTTIKKSLYFFS